MYQDQGPGCGQCTAERGLLFRLRFFYRDLRKFTGLQGSGFLQVNEAETGLSGITGTTNRRNLLTAPDDDTAIAGATVTITAVYPGHEDEPQTFTVTTDEEGIFSFIEAIPFDEDELTLPASVALTAEFAGDDQ